MNLDDPDNVALIIANLNRARRDDKTPSDCMSDRIFFLPTSKAICFFSHIGFRLLSCNS